VERKDGVFFFGNRARQGGIEGVIVRAGINGRRDHRFEEYVNSIRNTGLALPAVYWFANPKSSSSAQEQGDLLGAAAVEAGAPFAMIDAEWYTSEGGPNPVLKGAALAMWYSDMARAVSARTGNAPIIYTGATYWNEHVACPQADDDEAALGDALASMSDCDVIVASYPIYRPNGPAPGVPSTWFDFCQAHQRRLPPVPAGFSGAWAGWQFSAGFNRQGPVYGATSADLDLNIVRADVFERWTGTIGGTDVSRVPAPVPNDGVGDGLQGVAHATPNPSEALSLGSQGPNVRTVQIRLAILGYPTLVDGVWGPATQRRVLAFQRASGLTVDGIINVGGPTWTALNTKPVRPTVRPGCQGSYVAVLQRALNQLSGAALEDDGIYTTSSKSPTGFAIRAWQTAQGLEVDGVCGHTTWASVESRASDSQYTLT